MKRNNGYPDARLEMIARVKLNVPTLQERNSDGLDFHDLGVASLRAALEAAYELGKQDANHAATTSTPAR